MLLYNARATMYENTTRRKNRRAGRGKLGKIHETMGYGDKSPSILLGRSFQVLVSETSVYGVSPEKSGRAGRKTDGGEEEVKSSIGTTSLTIRCSSSHATKHYKIQVTLR